MIRQATCHCGNLRLQCSGEPVKVSLCNCLDCQRRTGSLFSVAAFFPRAAVQSLAGATQSFRRASASGFAVAFHSCTLCVSSLWWEPERMPHLVGVAVGAFADPDFPMPEQAVWTGDMHSWIRLPEAVPAYSRNPPSKTAVRDDPAPE